MTPARTFNPSAQAPPGTAADGTHGASRRSSLIAVATASASDDAVTNPTVMTNSANYRAPAMAATQHISPIRRARRWPAGWILTLVQASGFPAGKRHPALLAL